MPDCARCGQQHHATNGPRACNGHVKLRGPNGEPLLNPDGTYLLRGCAKRPMRGLDVCASHGGKNPTAAAVGRQRAADAAVTAAARKLIPDADQRTPITNPLERLLELASEADAFRESLRLLANNIQGEIRYRGTGAGAEQLRAEVSLYSTAVKDVTGLLVAIARLDIEKMLARVEARKVDAIVKALAAGADDAGLDLDQKRAVLRNAGRHLALLAS